MRGALAGRTGLRTGFRVVTVNGVNEGCAECREMHAAYERAVMDEDRAAALEALEALRGHQHAEK